MASSDEQSDHACTSTITRLVNEAGTGDARAAAELLPLVYDELRKLASHRLAREKPGQTLQATALVHEAYLRVLGPDAARQPHFAGRGHFFAAAAEAMRRILVDNARRKRSLKAGGGRRPERLEGLELPAVAGSAATLDLLALDDALQQLEKIEPRKASLVKLRFFAGLTNDQAAEVLSISSATAENDWAYAKAWLRLQVSGAPADPDRP